jgi:hypothetical protein
VSEEGISVPAGATTSRLVDVNDMTGAAATVGAFRQTDDDCVAVLVTLPFDRPIRRDPGDGCGEMPAPPRSPRPYAAGGKVARVSFNQPDQDHRIPTVANVTHNVTHLIFRDRYLVSFRRNSHIVRDRARNVSRSGSPEQRAVILSRAHVAGTILMMTRDTVRHRASNHAHLRRVSAAPTVSRSGHLVG